ncbi:hypothetical protein HCH_01008 [Hahella chejuensis KCTC 2396]|uniref:Uncharacterized protein n=1 Tax=Hahella chejuensis (strain KCTC 2396) TaxID=349521 RepID=Q2SN81_HAHCH|nr:hypothetical protein HCH_01008 [Hahella chejuensis KCTC 2396]
MTELERAIHLLVVELQPGARPWHHASQVIHAFFDAADKLLIAGFLFQQQALKSGCAAISDGCFHGRDLGVQGRDLLTGGLEFLSQLLYFVLQIDDLRRFGGISSVHGADDGNCNRDGQGHHDQHGEQQQEKAVQRHAFFKQRQPLCFGHLLVFRFFLFSLTGSHDLSPAKIQ